MSRRDDLTRLRHMRNHSNEALKLAQGKTRSDLDRDRLLNLALVRLLEIIVEAAARVSDEIREHNPQIPWQEIVSLRNRLIHGYDEVDFSILWEIITGNSRLLFLSWSKLLKSLNLHVIKLCVCSA